eukprot:TRINITY_DN3138_c0_g1_i12.p4 TRINITY_DN3138_c0_g1~~TRINITY_DN3138_c0_g1_i12.p4  ORF type:complete len:133 (+),score=45.59 TRINITY_DN3138_c0_g1_i12:1144-1542(+)
MKDLMAEAILELDKRFQTILMDIMFKYVKSEERKTDSQMDPEMVEALQQQLKEKEADRQNALEYISKLEQENKLLLKDTALLNEKVESLTKEKQQLREEIAKKTSSHNSNIEVHSSRAVSYTHLTLPTSDLV